MLFEYQWEFLAVVPLIATEQSKAAPKQCSGRIGVQELDVTVMDGKFMTFFLGFWLGSYGLGNFRFG